MLFGLILRLLTKRMTMVPRIKQRLLNEETEARAQKGWRDPEESQARNFEKRFAEVAWKRSLPFPTEHQLVFFCKQRQLLNLLGGSLGTF